MEILEESAQLKKLNEMFVEVLPSLPTKVENSIYYRKLRTLLHHEIIYFCKEQVELKEDLNLLRMMVGEEMSEKEIREYLDQLKTKYNTVDNNCALDYHIEVTRIDYGVPVFVVIKRGEKVYMKKLVFRFRKSDVTTSLLDVNNAGVPTIQSIQKNPLDALRGGNK